MKAKRNSGVSVAPTLKLTQEQLQQGTSAFTDWHWGVGPEKVIDWNDEDMPKTLVSCGQLIRLHVRLPRSGNRHPRQERDTMIQLSRAVSDNSFVAYDLDHPAQRLYLCVDPRARAMLKSKLWDSNDAPTLDLNHLAQIAGGRHGKRPDYPSVQVKPVGILTALVYFAHKQGDGPSYYIHQMAEMSGVHPILAVDSAGRLWLAGGGYTAPTPGITD
jgi:hypothetical protein